MYSDDDANSDASSACSERSYSSRNGGVAPHYLRQTEDVAEVLNHCASANWSERKEGLLGLQNLLKSQRMLRWVCQWWKTGLKSSTSEGLRTFAVELTCLD